MVLVSHISTTEFNFDEHLTQTCPSLSKTERIEARTLYAPILRLMKAQSLLHLGRYMASAIGGACCFETIRDGSVIKTDRIDRLKITAAARSIISLVDRVRGRVRTMARDIVFPHDKPIARASNQAPAVVNAYAEDTIEENGEVEGDDAMGAGYEESDKDDAQVPEVDDHDMVVVESEDEGTNDTLEHMYGCAFDLPFAKQECKPSAVTVQSRRVSSLLMGRRI